MAKKLENRWAEIIFIVLISVILLSSCGTTKRGGGCGGNPIHLGN
jgi:predicted small secreted protein